MITPDVVRHDMLGRVVMAFAAVLLVSAHALVPSANVGSKVCRSSYAPPAHGKRASSALESRRALLQAALASSPFLFPTMARAESSGPKWISGKSDPIRPTSKDKPDGTRKDYKYLSCLNDCVPRKQGPPGPNQKERADCLDDCQVECCETYEQCTYTIRK